MGDPVSGTRESSAGAVGSDTSAIWRPRHAFCTYTRAPERTYRSASTTARAGVPESPPAAGGPDVGTAPSVPRGPPPPGADETKLSSPAEWRTGGDPLD